MCIFMFVNIHPTAIKNLLSQLFLGLGSLGKASLFQRRKPDEKTEIIGDREANLPGLSNIDINDLVD